MSANLNNNFELDGASINISNNIDKIREKKEDDIDAEIDNVVNKVCQKGKINGCLNI